MKDVAPVSLDSFKCRKTLSAGGKTYTYYSLPEAEKNGLPGISKLPFSMMVLLENLLRHEDGRTVTKADIENVSAWLTDKGKAGKEIGFRPARVLMQDFTGVPAVVDLAAMRDGMKHLGGDPQMINPLVPVDLVIDHSVIVDDFGSPQAFGHNVELEYQRNAERYNFLKWGQGAFDNFRVVPPGTGICHQVNLEFLAQTVWTRTYPDGTILAYPDTLVGTDSHTTMVNGLAVLGWGVGGIEAEAAMLGQAQSMLLPEVIGFKLTGKLTEGVTATDLVLTVTQMLRKKGVVGKFVEFYGPGLDSMPLADRATIANMAPEYGATCGFFPIDEETLNYLVISGREQSRIALVEAYAKAQGMFRFNGSPDPVFTDTLELDLATVVPSMAGPKRPEGRIALTDVASGFAKALETEYKKPGELAVRVPVKGRDFDIGHGDVVIAAITSCTNTSNPSVLIAAGLLARNAVGKGLTSKPWVKTSLAPGSQVVSAYLDKAGLQPYLDKLGFNLVGFGCTTCIGNSGPLAPEISAAINENGVVAAAVLSGNRNFEGRVSPDVQANYLASPPLVVAYALAGTVQKDLSKEPVGTGSDGQLVYLKDIWPSSLEIQKFIAENITRELFLDRYADVFNGDASWRAIDTAGGETYTWDDKSTYVRNPPYFEGINQRPTAITDIKGARILGLFGDKITTDHISPAGSIKPSSPAGEYLLAAQRGRRRLQPVRHAARQSRGDDARHVRQHPHQELHGARRRRQRQGGRPHGALPLRRGHVDLRSRHALQVGGRAARRLRRRRVRQRLVARLGCQGHEPARGACRHRPVVRAHPSLEPRRHGHRAVRLRGRHELAVARPQGRRSRKHPGANQHSAAPDDDRGDHRRRRHRARGAHSLPHRHARRARVLQERRHSALRSAQPGGRLI